MYREIPQYCLKAYALFYIRFGTVRVFQQAELDWVVSQPMKKKIFSVLLNAGWIKKKGKTTYLCNKPGQIFSHLLDFKVQEILKKAERKYCLVGLSAIEVWSDYSYVQRDVKRSPYFIKVLKKDLRYWKVFFAQEGISAYECKGTNIGEFVILISASEIGKTVKRDGMYVESLSETMKEAKRNELYEYAYNYMREKYGQTATA
ncbi:MAG: hypothetical protein AB1391_02570 [Candidatus Micrarchaeota archaeon]